MIKKILVIPVLFLISSFCWNIDMHDIHMSKTKIDYDEQKREFKIRVHIWMDDLELDVKPKEPLNLFSFEEIKNADEILHGYLKEKLKFKINSEQVDFVWEKKEESEDGLAVWCVLNLKISEAVRSITVSNRILADVYEDQKNVIHLKGSDGMQGYFIFRSGYFEDELEF